MRYLMKLKFFNLAKKLSYKSDHTRCKLGCVIVKKDKILAIGFNKMRTHPKSPHLFKTIHAEFAAILSSNNLADLRNGDLYIFRQTQDGLLANSFPCIYCQDVIKEVGIRNVFYTDKNRYETREI
jgi:deoxycytidylate deaminase